jgi:hypothetical protein
LPPRKNAYGKDTRVCNENPGTILGKASFSVTRIIRTPTATAGLPHLGNETIPPGRTNRQILVNRWRPWPASRWGRTAGELAALAALGERERLLVAVWLSSRREQAAEGAGQTITIGPGVSWLTARTPDQRRTAQ